MANSKYTEQPYVGSEGKVLLADRVYVASVNTAPPTAKQAGSTPASYTDLGSINGSVVTLEKDDPDIIEVTTGLFEILRAEVARKDGNARARFTLVEYDPAIWASLTGDSTHVGANGGGVGVGVGIWTGGRPILSKALLLVGYNPVTAAEFHHYSPKVDLTYKEVEVDRFRAIEVTARFLKWTPANDGAALARDFELIYYV